MSGAAAAATPAAPSAAGAGLQQNHYALVIGIQHYRWYEPLDAPRADANRFCRWLTEVAKVPMENIQLVSGDQTGSPTNADILAAFDQLGLGFPRWKGERLYIYYAGHGVGPAVNEVAVLPADARINGTQQAFGAAGWVSHIFTRHLFTEIVMFLDCCRDATDAGALSLPYTPVSPASGFPPDVKQKYCVLIGSNAAGKSFQIAAGGGLSGEVAEDYRGLMTDALLEGLNGAYGAVDPTLNAVTTESLERYLTHAVDGRAKRAGLPQKATRLISNSDPILLLQLTATPELTLRLTIGPATAGKEVTLSNPRSDETIVLAAAGSPAGTSDHQLPTNTRYVLSVGGKMKDILDPTQMTNPSPYDLP